jgi:hypothetical protein
MFMERRFLGMMSCQFALPNQTPSFSTQSPLSRHLRLKLSQFQANGRFGETRRFSLRLQQRSIVRSFLTLNYTNPPTALG